MERLLPKKKTNPLSIRLSFQERKQLETMAGKTPLSIYVRNRLFSKSQQVTNEDQKHLAQILAKLGQSNMAAHLRELTQQARSGSLALTPEIIAKLDQACKDILEIKSILMKALRIKED